MTVSAFVHELNRCRFNGQLAATTIEHLEALHAEEREANMLAAFCGTLRADAGFSSAFADVNDRLRAKHGVCPRLPDGYLSDALPVENPAAMWIVAGDYSVELGEVLSDHACQVLARAGHETRVNEIGHVAVAID